MWYMCHKIWQFFAIDILGFRLEIVYNSSASYEVHRAPRIMCILFLAVLSFDYAAA